MTRVLERRLYLGKYRLLPQCIHTHIIHNSTHAHISSLQSQQITTYPTMLCSTTPARHGVICSGHQRKLYPGFLYSTLWVHLMNRLLPSGIKHTATRLKYCKLLEQHLQQTKACCTLASVATKEMSLFQLTQ